MLRFLSSPRLKIAVLMTATTMLVGFSSSVFAANETSQIVINGQSAVVQPVTDAAPAESQSETPQALELRRAKSWFMAGRDGCLKEILARSQSALKRKGIAELENGIFAVVVVKESDEICTCLFSTHGLTREETNLQCSRPI